MDSVTHKVVVDAASAHQPIIEGTVAAAASKATYLGSGAAVTGWLLSSEFAVLAGLVLGVAGFVVNFYYRRKQDRREQAEHDAKMALYQ